MGHWISESFHSFFTTILVMTVKQRNGDETLIRDTRWDNPWAKHIGPWERGLSISKRHRIWYHPTTPSIFHKSPHNVLYGYHEIIILESSRDPVVAYKADSVHIPIRLPMAKPNRPKPAVDVNASSLARMSPSCVEMNKRNVKCHPQLRTEDLVRFLNRYPA